MNSSLCLRYAKMNPALGSLDWGCGETTICVALPNTAMIVYIKFTWKCPKWIPWSVFGDLSPFSYWSRWSVIGQAPVFFHTRFLLTLPTFPNTNFTVISLNKSFVPFPFDMDNESYSCAQNPTDWPRSIPCPHELISTRIPKSNEATELWPPKLVFPGEYIRWTWGEWSKCRPSDYQWKSYEAFHG